METINRSEYGKQLLEELQNKIKLDASFEDLEDLINYMLINQNDIQVAILIKMLNRNIKNK